jgi:hypothetical protein
MKKLLTLIVLLLTINAVFAQRDFDEDSGWSFRDRAYFGVGLSGLNFGSSATYGKFFSIGVSGQIGYMLINNLSTGIGLEYQYESYGDINVKSHIYGGYPFVRYNIKSFFVQVDYDLVTIKANFENQEAKQNFERFFVGVGYSSETGGRGYLNVLVSYDFLYTNTSPFASPLSFRVYFTGWID